MNGKAEVDHYLTFSDFLLHIFYMETGIFELKFNISDYQHTSK